MSALSSVKVVDVNCGAPYRDGFGAKSVVTVTAKVDSAARVDYSDGLSAAVEILAEEYAPDTMAAARRRLVTMNADWHSLQFELQLI